VEKQIALEIRHLQGRTEVREAKRPFGGEQRGTFACRTSGIPVNVRNQSLRMARAGAVEIRLGGV